MYSIYSIYSYQNIDGKYKSYFLYTFPHIGQKITSDPL